MPEAKKTGSPSSRLNSKSETAPYLIDRPSKLLYLEWEDAHSTGGGWKYPPDREEELENSWLVREVGWVVGETPTRLILANQLVAGDPDVTGPTMSIPKSLIRKKRNLGKHL